MIQTLKLAQPFQIEISVYWCPLKPGTCAPPWDMQPVRLGRAPIVLDVDQHARTLLSGSILEHLRSGRAGLALSHAVRLVDLTADLDYDDDRADDLDA